MKQPLINYTKILRSKNAGPLYITFDLIFDTKENYEKYKLEDIPFVSRPTSASYVNKILGKLIQQADIDFNTNLKEDFAEWIEKEKKEWEAKKAETKAE